MKYVFPMIIPELSDEEEDRAGGTSEDGNAVEELDESGNPIPREVKDEDAIFIPLGWARQRTVQPYKGSDPEWKSFIAVSKDKQRGLKIRRELAALTGKVVSKHKSFNKVLGQEMKVGKYWLDFDFPAGPPPEYERGGLEITDDFIAWTIKPVTPQNYFRLHQALWPTALTSSFWASYTAVFSLEVQKFKAFFGMGTKNDQQLSTTIPLALQGMRGGRQTDNQQANSESASGNPSGPLVESSESAKSSVSSTSNPKPENSVSLRDKLTSLPSLPAPSQEMSTMLSAFMTKLAVTWKPAKPPPPRGTFLVSGLVEVQGSKAVCVIDVQAAYNPIESKWDQVALKVRRLQPRKQAPPGGQ
ncbi:MAG: hypothetical protein M1827_005497 [Pycnora praestabilis]|nr:MAG: hypothetical protein M1827_005497 [Pycnora praestabilis]